MFTPWEVVALVVILVLLLAVLLSSTVATVLARVLMPKGEQGWDPTIGADQYRDERGERLADLQPSRRMKDGKWV